MDVTMRNGIERCPQQCSYADIRTWNELLYGPSKASVVGVEVVVTCKHVCVCKKLADAIREEGVADADR